MPDTPPVDSNNSYRDVVLVGPPTSPLYLLAERIRPRTVIFEQSRAGIGYAWKRGKKMGFATLAAHAYLRWVFNKGAAAALKEDRLVAAESKIVERIRSRDVKGRQVILFSSSIIREKTINAAAGVINIHLGWLPTFKGPKPEVSAVLGGGPLGVTIHHVTPQVDAGKIVARRTLDFDAAREQLTYTEMKLRLLYLAIDLVNAYIDGTLADTEIENVGGQWHDMPSAGEVMRSLRMLKSWKSS